MPATDPEKLVREREIARTDGNANPRPMSGRDEACADYNNMTLDEWRAALGADLEDRFGPVPRDLVPVGKAGW